MQTKYSEIANPATWSDAFIESIMLPEGHHGHLDCIRLAAAWLMAQQPIKSPTYSCLGIKHRVEREVGRYVSADDVTVAGNVLGLTRIVRGIPFLTISRRTTKPAPERFLGIGEYMQHPHYIE